jgi:signal recognition particle subunit SRP54
MRKGWKVALVCADTFRAGAFDQLKQNATKCRIPFYGSYTEMDPVKIAEEGVSYFKKQNFELIIIDTSGRHKQEEALFDEMKQVASATNPDDIIFVMDSHIGQACHDQALAFKKAVDIGSVIITKLDGHAKGGGALSAVAATESPIIFIGTGEHFEDFETFNPESFIKRILGMGDIKGLFEKVKEVVSAENQAKLAENLQKGVFTLRDMRDQYQSVMKMGPLDKVVSMIPGLSNTILPPGKEKDASAKIKKYLCMMDSMTDEELDRKKKIDESRMKRIARGCGCLPIEVHDMLEEYNRFSKMVEKMGKLTKNKGDLTNLTRNPGQMASQLGSIVPQNILNQLGGTGNLMNMMKEMGQLEGMNQQIGGHKGRRGKR